MLYHYDNAARVGLQIAYGKWSVSAFEGTTMTSAARVSANRANAQKSTGPRRPGG